MSQILTLLKKHHCLFCRWKRQGSVTLNSLLEMRLGKPGSALNTISQHKRKLSPCLHTCIFTHGKHYHPFQGALGNRHRFYLPEQPSLHHEKSLSQPKFKKKTKNKWPEREREHMQRPQRTKDLPPHLSTHKPWMLSKQSIQGHYLRKSGSWGDYILKPEVKHLK